MTSTTDLRLMLNRVAILASELNTGLGPLRQVLADARAGGVQAQSYDSGRRERDLWCPTHERFIGSILNGRGNPPAGTCRAAGLYCDGVPDIDRSDPTGDAAIARATMTDQATRDLRKHDDGIRRALEGLQTAAAVAGAWNLAPPEPDDSCPDGCCLSCWRHEHTMTPTAEGRYRDRCRWCGDFRGEHGIDPPLAVLVARHTPGMVVSVKLVAESLAKAGRKLTATRP